jgi:tRNA(adenine34) deaminase
MTPEQKRKLDLNFAATALHQAELAFSAGDCPVGAVLVNGEGFPIRSSQNQMTRRSGHVFHAELMLLFECQKELKEHPATMTLYVTLEPCLMCLGAAAISRVSRIVYLVPDPWAGGTQCCRFDSPYFKERLPVLELLGAPELTSRAAELLQVHFRNRSPLMADRLLGKLGSKLT